MTIERLTSDFHSSIPILQKIADGQTLSFDEAWLLVTIYKRYKDTDAFVDYVEDMPRSEYAKLRDDVEALAKETTAILNIYYGAKEQFRNFETTDILEEHLRPSSHMMFDWTKPNGKSLSLNKSHMSELQTLVADVLGMERGVSSDVKHLNAVQYKNKKEGERLLALQQQNAELQEQVEQLEKSNEQLRSDNAELLLKAEEIRKTVADLQAEV